MISIRGLTVDGWIVADEAARLSEDLISALRPMRARAAGAVCDAVDGVEPDRSILDGMGRRGSALIRMKATAGYRYLFRREFLEQERRALGEHGFNREYLGIPGGARGQPVQLGPL